MTATPDPLVAASSTRRATNPGDPGVEYRPANRPVALAARRTRTPGASTREVARDGAAATTGMLRTFAVLGIIAICCGLLAWRLWSVFLFADDDLLQFEVADRYGFSRELLTLNVFGHFAPVDRTGHLMLLQLGLNPTAGVVLATGLVGLLLVVVNWLSAELGLSLVKRLLIISAAGSSVTVLSAARWADGALHLFPALTITYAVIALHVRGIRTGRRRWHLISVLVFPLGLLTQERAAFALPLIVLADLLLVWNQLSVGQRLRNLWAVRWPLAGMAVLGLIGAYLIKRNYGGAGALPDPATMFRTLSLAFTNFQFSSLIGVAEPPLLTDSGQFAVGGLIAASCAVLIAVNRRNTGPLIFWLCSWALYWGFLVFSPILNPSLIVKTASSLGYAGYLLVPTLITLGSLHGPRRIGTALRRWRGDHPVQWLWAGWLAAVLVAMTLSAVGFVSDRVELDSARQADTFYRGARESAPQWADLSVTVVPLRAPVGVADENGWSTPYADHQFLLPLISPGWRLGDLTPATVVLDADGRPQPVVLSPVGSAASQAADCNSPADASDGVQLPTTRVNAPGPLFAKITYRSDTSGALKAIIFDDGSYRVGAWSQPVDQGVHTTIVPLPAGSIDAVRLFGMPAGSTLCVQSLELVSPLLVTEPGECVSIDKFAEPVEPVRCPVD